MGGWEGGGGGGVGEYLLSQGGWCQYHRFTIHKQSHVV